MSIRTHYIGKETWMLPIYDLPCHFSMSFSIKACAFSALRSLSASFPGSPASSIAATCGGGAGAAVVRVSSSD